MNCDDRMGPTDWLIQGFVPKPKAGSGITPILVSWTENGEGAVCHGKFNMLLSEESKGNARWAKTIDLCPLESSSKLVMLG